MVSVENTLTASMVRPSTCSQDGVPPSTNEHTQAKSHLDATFAPVVNDSVAPRKIPPSRSRSQNVEDIVKPIQSSPDPPASDLRQTVIPRRRS
uniref:Uncharacterized protein n=1 Tax=Cannabis sativa TaxID=3483 RepID=A0A803PQQ7_CANSA